MIVKLDHFTNLIQFRGENNQKNIYKSTTQIQNTNGIELQKLVEGLLSHLPMTNRQDCDFVHGWKG